MSVHSILLGKSKPAYSRSISVVIPAFNEEETLESVIHRTRRTLDLMGNAHEIIVVDDGSTDQTCNIASKEGVTIVRNHRNGGKGRALKMGFDRCNGEVIVTIDADGSHQPEEVPKLISPIIKNEVDMVIGSRFNGQMEEKAVKTVNIIGNKLFNVFIFLLSGRRLTDSQSGFRAFSRDVLSNLNVRSKGYEIESEITVELIQKGFVIGEVPIKCTCAPRNSRLRAFRDGCKILKTIISTYFRWM